MITLRRAHERRYDQHSKQRVWLTFYPRDEADPLANGFGSLEGLIEKRLSPGAGAPRHLQPLAEIVTYVREGALAYQDSTDRSGVILAGEFQGMVARSGIDRRETNASRTNWAHVFQVRLHATEADHEPHEQKRFSAAERRGVPCIVASPDARRGSLRIHQDALMYSALLVAGQHVVYEIAPERIVWLHVVQGEVALADTVLTTGDGAGMSAERAMSLTARAETEILFLDLLDQPPGSAPTSTTKRLSSSRG